LKGTIGQIVALAGRQACNLDLRCRLRAYKMDSETYLLRLGHFQIEVMAISIKFPQAALRSWTWPKGEELPRLSSTRVCDLALDQKTSAVLSHGLEEGATPRRVR
jgi:hypothetical protein